jgi:hypothetical protein
MTFSAASSTAPQNRCFEWARLHAFRKSQLEKQELSVHDAALPSSLASTGLCLLSGLGSGRAENAAQTSGALAADEFGLTNIATRFAVSQEFGILEGNYPRKL